MRRYYTRHSGQTLDLFERQFDTLLGVNSQHTLSRSERDIYTVSRLNRTVRELVELTLGMVWVEGEISNLSKPASGHVYFSLKDARAQVRCAFFKQRVRMSRVQLDVGKQVRVRARASLYEPRGDYQLIVESVEAAGDGLLQQRYQENLKRFADEGLFDTERKQTLPPHPEHIGVVTSATGAAVRDVVEVLRRRYALAEVTLYPTPVQGDAAAASIAAAIDLANDHGAVDVLLIVRGGGSLEDLWAFNEEVVVRAVARSTLPTVSGVGHEVDTTLCDLVADQRAPTPSAAAELVSPPLDNLLTRLSNSERRLTRALLSMRQHARQGFNALQARLALQHPERQVQTAQQRFDYAQLRLNRAMARRCELTRNALENREMRLENRTPERLIAARKAVLNAQITRLQHAMKTRIANTDASLKATTRALDAISPLATLDRGYAVVRKATDGAVIQDATDVGEREQLRITLRRGELVAETLPTQKK